jgi:hypothetical protein
VQCFSSNYIRDIISRSSNEKGKCDFCESLNTPLYSPKNLYQFKNILGLYIPKSKVISNESISPLKLEEQILIDFPTQIFTLSNTGKIREFLLAVVEDEISEWKDVFNEQVVLECIANPVNRKQAEILKLSWDEFANEIKFENRYHIKHAIDLGKLEILLKRLQRNYSKGTKYFRSRISCKNGYPTSEMSNPPSIKTKGGRANPEGISYLYLSNDLDTTVYETRAYLFDYITIGEFILKEDITVVNLRKPKIFDPLLLADTEDLQDYLIHLPFMSHLENELSKPVRRNDNEFDYIPSQYLSEFIKSLGYDGIEYSSSLNPNGYNFAIFTPEKIECVKAFVVEIDDIKFNHKAIL